MRSCYKCIGKAMMLNTRNKLENFRMNKPREFWQRQVHRNETEKILYFFAFLL